MSRSGYVDFDCYDDEHMVNLYRGSVERPLRGSRGQKALVDFIAALDAIPEKKLVKDYFRKECGVCSLGALASYRGVDVSDLEPYVDESDGWVGEVDSVEVGRRLDISKSMASEVMYENDECIFGHETDNERLDRMRNWAMGNLNEKNQAWIKD